VRKRVIGAVTITSALMLAGSAAAGSDRPPEEPKAERQQQASQRLLPAGSRYLLARIDRRRAETWRWQRLMGKPRSPSSLSDRRSRSPEYRRWVLSLWQKRAARERRLAHNPPRRAQWLCIYRHERHPAQGWATRTGNGFYGGLQMNIAFQRQYGGWLLRAKGTADRWTHIEQIWVAERAYRSGRGFYPWPNTARYCGLI
jgi:hypothetical protein